MARLLPALLVVAALGACGGEAEEGPGPGAATLDLHDQGDDADPTVLDPPAGEGNDLTRPADVRWTVFFESNRAAEAFAALAREAGWTVERQGATRGARAVCRCVKRLVPTPEATRAMRAELEALGQGLSPEIHGWRIPAER